MSNTATVLAFDFGASSGRAIRAVYDGQNLNYEEIHRFENIPIEKDGHLCWDVETLLKEIHTAIQKAGTFDSLGFDTWGVDFGLLDTDGHLLANPVHYRDARTNGKPEQAAARMPAEELYAGVLQKYFGIRAEWVDEVEILRRISIGIYDHDEYEKALAWVRENCKEGFDKNLGKNLPPVITKSKIVPADKDWEFIVKMTLIIRDILYGNPRLDEMGWHEEALGRNAVVGGFQGQRQWTDWLPNADFTEAIMASTFDWNGPKAPTPFATENDTCNGIAMMLGSLVSGSAPCFHDVRTYWSPEACERVTGQKPDGVAANGFIHLINSGATALDGSGACVDAKGNHVMKPFWKMTDADIKACLNATDWCRADYEYFRGGGYSSHFRCKAEMPVTMLRFNIVEGIGPVLQIAEGWTADLPDEIHNTIDKRTDPTWPTTWFCPRLTGQGAFTDVYSVMANWGANHGVTVYGHVGADLITLASMLRIPVTMHNVPAEKIYRPHAWASFGTQDQQAADYAACKQYGPLYR